MIKTIEELRDSNSPVYIDSKNSKVYVFEEIDIIKFPKVNELNKNLPTII